MIARCTARALTTGSAPGSPRQTAQVCVLGGSPKDSSQPQNIFVRVFSWTWISRPITGSSSSIVGAEPGPAALAPAVCWFSDTGGRGVKCERLLEGEGAVEQPAVAEGRP